MTDEQADKIIGLLGVIAERLAHPMVAMAHSPCIGWQSAPGLNNGVYGGSFYPYEQRPNMNYQSNALDEKATGGFGS